MASLNLKLRNLVVVSVGSVLNTLLVVFLVSNIQTPEAKVEHRIERLYDIRDPFFRREMSTLLGPAIVSGNRIDAFQNGDEIFPAMLSAIEAAKHTIDF